jgi:hypothetical protein
LPSPNTPTSDPDAARRFFPLFQKDKYKPVPVGQGGCVVFDARLPHAGSPNQTHLPRVTAFVMLAPDGLEELDSDIEDIEEEEGSDSEFELEPSAAAAAAAPPRKNKRKESSKKSASQSRDDDKYQYYEWQCAYDMYMVRGNRTPTKEAKEAYAHALARNNRFHPISRFEDNDQREAWRWLERFGVFDEYYSDPTDPERARARQYLDSRSANLPATPELKPSAYHTKKHHGA